MPNQSPSRSTRSFSVASWHLDLHKPLQSRLLPSPNAILVLQKLTSSWTHFDEFREILDLVVTSAIERRSPHTEHFNNEKGSEWPVFKNTLRIFSDIYLPKKSTEEHIVIFFQNCPVASSCFYQHFSNCLVSSFFPYNRSLFKLYTLFVFYILW